MKKTRPTNIRSIDLLAFSFPVTSISSILHRLSGVLLYLCVPFCLWILQMSLTEAGFVEVKSLLTNNIFKFTVWVIFSLLAYHIVAGIRHLLMDAGIGETLQGGRFGSFAVITLGVIMAVISGVLIW